MLTTERLEEGDTSTFRRAERVRITPSRLRAISVGLAAVVLVTGVIAALAALQRQSATTAASQHSEGLVVDAQAIDTYLSDADTTAAGSFLQGQIEPVALRSRYASDVSRASASLAEAAQQVGSDRSASESITAMSVNIPVYTGLVQTATFNERQAYYPLAAAYLGEANSLMQTAILPAAQHLYSVENQRLADNLASAQGAWLVVLAAVLLVVSLSLLVMVQIWYVADARFRTRLPTGLPDDRATPATSVDLGQVASPPRRTPRGCACLGRAEWLRPGPSTDPATRRVRHADLGGPG
jgi:CHASE3 domain sensor protein